MCAGRVVTGAAGAESNRRPVVAVIGAGPGGIAMGIQLVQNGYDFFILERSDGFGGTWRKNTYPGVACDVPSHFYSFSFALNPYWSKTFANQPEILAYLEKVAHDHGLDEHLRTNTTVTTLRWSDVDARWTMETSLGNRFQVDVVVSAVGMLDVPNIPEIPGRELFRGRVFHSSSWDHSKSTAGERVASIGTGASAIQYVPAIAAETQQRFTVLTPNGVTSMIYIIEAQAQFVGRMLGEMRRRGIGALDVRRDVHDTFNAEIQQAMVDSVWQANCNNYFRHPSGKVVTQFPYSGSTFAKLLAEVDVDVFTGGRVGSP